MGRMSANTRGMSGDHCVRAIGGALAGIERVRWEPVDVGSALLESDPAVVEPARIRGAASGEWHRARSLAGAS